VNYKKINKDVHTRETYMIWV